MQFCHLVFVFAVLSQSLFAIFCPHCGTSNEDEYRFCYSCGKALPQKSSKVQPASRAVPAGVTQRRSVGSGNIPMHGKHHTGIFSAPSSGAKAQTTKEFSANLQQMMQGQAVKGLLDLQGQNIDSDTLSELNQNPQVQQLMQMMKNPQFQNQLLDGLMQMSPPSSNNPMSNQVEQLRGLFQMLNSVGSQNLLQP